MSTTKKSTRARPADQDAAAPASTSAPDADVSPPHTDAAAALLAAGEPARAAAEAPAPTCAPGRRAGLRAATSAWLA